MFRKCVGVLAVVAFLVTVIHAPDSLAKRPERSSTNGWVNVQRSHGEREVIRDFRYDDDDWLPDRGGGDDEPFDETDGHDWEGAQVVNPADSEYLILSIPWLGLSVGQIVPIWITFQPLSSTPTTGASSYIPKVPNQEKTDHGVKKGKKRAFDTARPR